MKTVKTIVTIALFLIGSVSFAQGPAQGQGRQMRSATERAKNETTRLVKSLELDSAQTAALCAINMKYAVQDSIRFAGMRGNNNAQVDREKMMQEMRATQEAKAKEVNAILKEGQKANYKKYLEERQQRGQGQGGQRQGGQGGPGNQGGAPN